MKKCSVCGYLVDGRNLHKESLPIPEGEAEYYLIHASCAGIEEIQSPAAEKAWVIESMPERAEDDPNLRPCNCGSGVSWVQCNANSPYCE